jgi:ankyrin repeat protein
LQLAYYSSPGTELLEMLLQNGVDPNITGLCKENKDSLLTLAIKDKKENHVRLLLEHGANPNPTTEVKQATMVASPSEYIQADVSLQKHLSQLSKSKLQVSVTQDEIPLITAIISRNKPIIADLLKFGASVTQKNELGFNAFGNEACSETFFPDFEILDLLIKYGANINEIQGKKDGYTALYFACQRNDFDTVKKLIALGANPNQQMLIRVQRKNLIEQESMTPLYQALYKGHWAICNFLIEQTTQPIEAKTAALAFALHIKTTLQSNICINVEDLSIFCHIPIGLGTLHKFILEHNPIDLKKVVKEAFEEAQQSFRKQKYEQAISLFNLCLFFGEYDIRHQVLYNMASCWKAVNEQKFAIQCFTICKMHKPGSVISNYAIKQLARLPKLELEPSFAFN